MSRGGIKQGGTMYRTLLPIFICVSAVHTAPQETNSLITYVKLAPNTDTQNSSRESRIENIPLIIQDNRSEEDDTSHNNASEEDTTSTDQGNNKKRSEEVFIRNPILRFDNRREGNRNNKSTREGDSTRKENEDDDNRNRSEENVRTVRSDVTTVNFESETTAVTERDNSIDEVDQTDVYESRTKPPAPKFISKLSYFQKNDISSPVLTNLVERPGRRRFKSKCRCEKIWNCPKLQITVPRCPNEYFLCCF